MTKIKGSAKNPAKYNHKNIWLCEVGVETGCTESKNYELYRLALVLIDVGWHLNLRANQYFSC
jgi:hypothetical protein